MSLFANVRRTAFVALCLAMAGPASAAVTPTDADAQAAREVAESLRYGHYEDVTLDDHWANRAFTQYLKTLDPQKAYLLDADISEFSDLRHDFDDAMVDGDLERIYGLYERYQQRLTARLTWLVKTLDAKPSFDFDKDDRLALDRKDSPWADSEQELDELWRKRLKNAWLSMSLSDKSDDEIAKTLSERYSNQLKRIKQTNDEDILTLVMHAVTGSIDPHSEYFSPRQGESFDIQMKLSLDGIGALLQSEGEYVKVSSLVPGGPAEKDGELKPADRIVAVGQGQGDSEWTNVVGMRLDDVVDLIRGPKGSVVRLEVIPAQSLDVTKTRELDITRDTVKLEDQAANAKVIDVKRDDGVHRIGVIHVPAFYVDFDAWQAGEDDYRSTTRDVARLIDELKAKQVEGIILDLRNNGGGALQEANSMIGLFIDRGPTVQVRDARGRISLYGDTDAGTHYDGPLTVLVNRLSASASEIFAGAIQDYGRGPILGSQTFGKGTVQTISSLSEGEIKLTRAKFYRISGDSTQNKGVKPDIAFPSVIDPQEIGESSLDYALPWDQVRPVKYRRYGDPARYLAALRARHQSRVEQDPNFSYLKSEVALSKALRAQQTSISLNREQRKREMDAQEAEQLALENKRRRALNLEPLTSFAELDAASYHISSPESDPEQEADIEDASSDKEAKDPIDQAQLQESAEILLDYAHLTGDR
ncbi:carboxy terminal-processing peptidase [Cobetia sp. 29-18-1]|uniref:carboxy terminal-processing peptidase n=1 Tax=Cobetia sp. 29-18-1 TaxID=3040018 RepID=UPI002449028E|nr:carboxy terminal-processing peptidase [Cobetia sp. 29-18-1]MDH2299307.1 carboxy terminal-processing peptidase [Cobetia sp. 29-18-1]